MVSLDRPCVLHDPQKAALIGSSCLPGRLPLPLLYQAGNGKHFGAVIVAVAAEL